MISRARASPSSLASRSISRTSRAASRLACVSTAATSSALACSAVSPAARSSTASRSCSTSRSSSVLRSMSAALVGELARSVPPGCAHRCRAVPRARRAGSRGARDPGAARRGRHARSAARPRCRGGAAGRRRPPARRAGESARPPHARGPVRSSTSERVRARMSSASLRAAVEGDVRQRVTAVRTGSHDVRRMARPA